MNVDRSRLAARAICADSTVAERKIRTEAAEAFGHYANEQLAVPEPQVIRAGIAGGLPFDSLTTDLFLGCLPAREVCYGNCFAARAAFANGFDFGTRVENILDDEVLRADLAAIPRSQAFLRNGWNSDPSWGWRKGAHLARLIRESGRHTIFITKAFAAVPPDVADDLVQSGAELRISMSAFDTTAQLEMRIRVAESYRKAGGVAVPLIMSAIYKDDKLNAKQDALVRYMIERDLPAAENSLRFHPQSPVRSSIQEDACGRVAGSGDLWAGRLYTGILNIPTTTTLPPSYRGLQSGYASRNDRDFIASLWHDPVHTHEEVLSGAALDKPKQCGVALRWQDVSATEDERKTLVRRR